LNRKEKSPLYRGGKLRNFIPCLERKGPITHRGRGREHGRNLFNDFLFRGGRQGHLTPRRKSCLWGEKLMKKLFPIHRRRVTKGKGRGNANAGGCFRRGGREGKTSSFSGGSLSLEGVCGRGTLLGGKKNPRKEIPLRGWALLFEGLLEGGRNTKGSGLLFSIEEGFTEKVGSGQRKAFDGERMEGFSAARIGNALFLEKRKLFNS